MIVVRRDIVEAFFSRKGRGRNFRAARRQWDAWLAEAIAASWRSPIDVKARYASASILKSGRIVFNIKGNDFRLVVLISYRASVVEIRFFGTHGEYDRINAEII